MEYLALEIFDLSGNGSQYATLPEDASLSITDTSEIFASGDIWSHDFTLNVYANAHIFGTTGDLHGSRLHDLLEKRRARLWVMGLPLYTGYLKLGDEVDVDKNGNVKVSFESGRKTFKDVINGAKANQVPLMDKVRFGVAIWRERWVRTSCTLQLEPELAWTNSDIFAKTEKLPVFDRGGGDTFNFTVDGEKDLEAAQKYPRMVYPKGQFIDLNTGDPASGYPGDIKDIDCINTDYPYDDNHPYCNIALCYQRMGYKRKVGDGSVLTDDYTQDPTPQRGYEYMPANRINSAPNFYVIYWLRCLMKHLGIFIEENQMMDVEDLRRLFFVNTNCDYKEPKKMRTDSSQWQTYGRYSFLTDYRDIFPEQYNKPDWAVFTKKEECKFQCIYQLGEPQYDDMGDVFGPEDIPAVHNIKITLNDILQSQENIYRYRENNRYLHDAYATSKCFPDAEIDEVIKALESGFGVRFLFDGSFQRVRIILLRNIFQNKEIQEVNCEILDEDVKVENSIRGFRMTYGKGKDDTQYYYKGFNDKLPHKKQMWLEETDKHDYSQWDFSAVYEDIIRKVSAFDKKCYVTPATGNAHIIKVDKDAKRYEDLHPSLFGCADYMDAEDGDCTGEDETIEEISVGFTPAIMNDLNMDVERRGDKTQKFALFVDAEMMARRPDLQTGVDYNNPDAAYDVDGRLYGSGEFTNMMKDGIVKPGEFALTSDMTVSYSGAIGTAFTWLSKIIRGPRVTDVAIKTTSVQWPVTGITFSGAFNEGYRLYLQDNYKPNDEGISPIEKHEWGLTLGIMRGSGSDAHVSYSDDSDDPENDTWDIVPGSNVTAHPDTCDSYGRQWDYDTEPAGRTIEAMYLREAGWPVSGGDNELVSYSYHYNFNTPDGVYDLLLTPIKDLSQQARSVRSLVLTRTELESYVQNLWDEHGEHFVTADHGQHILLAKRVDGTTFYSAGRVSLKLRAEKPNPYFDLTLPNMITTKADAGRAMTSIYTTANCDLLTRPKVSGATMRAAGWDVPEDSYSTVYGVTESIMYSDGTIHNILWTPIETNGHVLTMNELMIYTNIFNGKQLDNLATLDTKHLILDIDTTELRAETLHKLQTLYYAEPGESVQGVYIEPLRYLEITTTGLQGRGLCDTFYKEYSYWIRNARIVKRTVRMELAQLLTIDKTKKVRVGDITGYIRKIQYTISNKTGLGTVTMEIMYI